MPQGLVRSGDFRNGTPMTLPHNFGNLIGQPEPFGNVIPQSNSTLNGNPVSGSPTPNMFGNQVSFSLQTVPSVVIVSPGGVGTTTIDLTNLLGVNSESLRVFGTPVGVTVTFAPSLVTTTSLATITVDSSVPAGRYTITVLGSSSRVPIPNMEYTFIQLVVTGTIPIPVGLQRAQVDIPASALNNSLAVPVQIIPAQGAGTRINVVNMVFQSSAGTPDGTGVKFNLGPPQALANNTPEFNVDAVLVLNSAERISSLFSNETSETEGEAPLAVSLFNNQPYMLSTSRGLTGTLTLRVISYYTVESIH
jgi:hypothetical protein